jgi:hypothetical protein
MNSILLKTDVPQNLNSDEDKIQSDSKIDSKMVLNKSKSNDVCNYLYQLSMLKLKEKEEL